MNHNLQPAHQNKIQHMFELSSDYFVQNSTFVEIPHLCR